jgi:hypothetical protein
MALESFTKDPEKRLVVVRLAEQRLSPGAAIDDVEVAGGGVGSASSGHDGFSQTAMPVPWRRRRGTPGT